jgi:hypothetical protein
MGCCGQKRVAASAGLRRQDRSTAPSRTAPSRAAPVGAARGADVLVRYLGARPVRVRGAASGRTYHSSSADPLLSIDARDAAALIRTGLFR